MSLKLIFMGTPEFAVPILISLYKSKHDILSVYTQSPKKSNRGQKINISPIHKISNELGLNVRHPDKLNKEEIDHIKKLSPNIAVVVAYGKLIPSDLLNISNIKFINIHPSLLPRWRGAAPIQRSIIEMDSVTGVSIMKIIPELDAGPYLLQEKIKIEKKDNYISLSKKLSLLASELILKSLEMIEQNNFILTNQDKSKVTYAKKIEKKESEIIWNIDAKSLIAKINGLSPYPGAWFKHKGKRFKIIKAEEFDQSGTAGQVLDDNLTIGCKYKSIKILSLQKEGKKILNVKEFLAGYKISKGEKLN